MQKTITDQNLCILIDILIKEGTRVVAPRQNGSITLYEPLDSGEQLALGTLPRRSAKETFFPLCETILTYEKNCDGVKVADVDVAAFTETVLVGARPAMLLHLPFSMPFSPGITTTSFSLSVAVRPPSSGWPVPLPTTHVSVRL